MKREHRKLSSSKLFKTVEDLVDGYGLFVDAKKNRKVTLIGRPLPSGKVSLFRYSYQNGRKVMEKTGAILESETNQEVKNDNKETLRAQNVICDELNANLIRENANFKPINRTRTLMADYIDECKGKMKPSFKGGLEALKKHLNNFDNKLRVCDMDVNVIREFVTYLREEARSLVYTKTSVEAPLLKENTQVGLLAKLSIVLNRAVDEDLISYNGLSKLQSGERPKVQDDVRTYLSKDELKKLMHTDYNKAVKFDKFPNTPKAFFFTCFTGLRFSDVVRLTGKNVGKDDGGLFILFQVKKTGKWQKLYLNDCAKSYLPKAKADEVLFSLPCEQSLNKDLKKWASAAGITKNISFHVARHTCATLMLSAHVPLEVVSNQLGHKSVRTTQRYAKVTGENQRQGANMMANFFEQD